MDGIRLRASYYRQYDADHDREIPAEGYAGWQSEEITISAGRTALVMMHAWDTGTREKYPGWYRAVEYLPRADRIARTVFPPLLGAVRSSPLPIFHVVGGGGGDSYYSHLPGYARAVELAGPEPPPVPAAETDPFLEELRKFKSEKAFHGSHNREDIELGFRNLGFHPCARPRGKEGVARNGHQLFALCRERGINHLVYCGFAINWCLFSSPGGMHEMTSRGFLCSTIRQAVTAVENRETARTETAREIALWRVGLGFGFVFNADDFIGALETHRAGGPGAGKRRRPGRA